jgi:hypothetical protein
MTEREALIDAITRMDRARGILQEDGGGNLLLEARDTLCGTSSQPPHRSL